MNNVEININTGCCISRVCLSKTKKRRVDKCRSLSFDVWEGKDIFYT